jgi:polyisoprenoid-binding protein YceI
MRRLIAWLLLLPLPALAADTYELDPGHTFPAFAIDHMGYSTHTGRFNRTTGEFVLDRKGDGSSVNVVIQTASIDTGDERLEEKLRSADFFNVERFPDMRYRSTKVTWTGETTAEVAGELTLLGITRPVALSITEARCSVHPYLRTWWCGFAVQGQLRRSDFGMTAGIPMVGDEVRISIQAEGGRRKDSGGPRR